VSEKVACSLFVRKEAVEDVLIPGKGSASAADNLAQEIKGKILRGVLCVVEKKVQGRGRPSDKLYGVREFAFCDEIFEGGWRRHLPHLRQLLPKDLLRTTLFSAEVEHCGRRSQGLVVPSRLTLLIDLRYERY
jgi:hypothetical protein